MTSKMTLDETVEQINKWRNSKTGPRGRIPDYIWRNAVQLTKRHSIKTIATKLHLKSTDLESKVEDLSKSLVHVKKNKTKIRDVKVDTNHFIEVNTNDGLSQVESSCVMELQLNNGATIRIYQ